MYRYVHDVMCDGDGMLEAFWYDFLHDFHVRQIVQQCVRDAKRVCLSTASICDATCFTDNQQFQSKESPETKKKSSAKDQ
jgi:hypothetical protein